MVVLDRPIPLLERAPTAENYHDIPIDLQDPRNRETLVDARDYGLAGENYYSRIDGQNEPYRQPIEGAIPELWCRQTIITMLLRVNKQLIAHGVELFLWDAYRPITCQQGIWTFFWEKIRREISQRDEKEISSRVQQYVSDPRQFDRENPRTWPVHTTGAAVDLTLRDLRNGKHVGYGDSCRRNVPGKSQRSLRTAFKSATSSRPMTSVFATVVCFIGRCGTKDLPTTATNSGISIMATKCTP